MFKRATRAILAAMESEEPEEERGNALALRPPPRMTKRGHSKYADSVMVRVQDLSNPPQMAHGEDVVPEAPVAAGQHQAKGASRISAITQAIGNKTGELFKAYYPSAMVPRTEKEEQQLCNVQRRQELEMTLALSDKNLAHTNNVFNKALTDTRRRFFDTSALGRPLREDQILRVMVFDLAKLKRLKEGIELQHFKMSVDLRNMQMRSNVEQLDRQFYRMCVTMADMRDEARSKNAGAAVTSDDWNKLLQRQQDQDQLQADEGSLANDAMSSFGDSQGQRAFEDRYRLGEGASKQSTSSAAEDAAFEACLRGLLGDISPEADAQQREQERVYQQQQQQQHHQQNGHSDTFVANKGKEPEFVDDISSDDLALLRNVGSRHGPPAAAPLFEVGGSSSNGGRGL